MSQRPAASDDSVLQILVTEHTNLQAARSGTIFEANGRTNIFLGTVSSAVVALAFIGQVSEMSGAFLLFALILLPALMFMGIVTYVRVLQTGWEDHICARGINRIRHYYTEIAPHMKDYFIMSTHDDDAGFLRNMGAIPSNWQMILSTAGLVNVINSVVAGVFFGLVTNALLRASLAVSVIVGLAVFALSVYLHIRYHIRYYDQINSTLTVMFPSDEKMPG